MRIGIGRLLVFVSIILVVGLSWHITGAQSVEEQYFPKTGFWVRGEILRFYNSTPYAEEIYGQPRSTVFKKNENLYMQYFDKACFELYVDPQAGENVQLCDLGARIYEPEKGTPQDIFTTDCREYPETEFGKFEVCSFFLEYFESRGGLAQFGPPISGIEKIGDVYMQYFQNARLEYRPNLLGEENRVVVSDLAIMYFHLIRENRIYLQPEPGNAGIDVTIELKSRAFPQKAVTKLSGTQTIHVIAQDQRLMAAPNALVYVEVKMPNGEPAPEILPVVTDEDGVAVVSFDYETDKPGMVEILVRVKNDSLETRTVTSFRTWW